MKPFLLTLTLSFIILHSSIYLSAQEEFVEPSRFITRFHFTQYTGGVVMLKGQFGSFPDSLSFILDTGSGGISLDSTRAQKLGLKPQYSNRSIRGIAGIRKVRFLYNQQLRLPNLTIDSLQFHINNYEILTAVYGERIDGIIGYSVISRYIIKLNYDSSIIEFWSRGVMQYPAGGYTLKPTITTSAVQTVRVRDRNTISAQFLYDIGAGMNMIFSTDFINSSSLLSRKRKLYTKIAEGLGGKINMSITVIKEVKLGPFRFRNVPVYVFDDLYNATSFPDYGGLIGNDLLRRFNVIMDYDKKQIHLLPNSFYNSPFDYSYTGIELYFIDNKVLIGDVATNSPAEKAGLKEGDEVVAIDKNFKGSLQQYKQAIQNARRHISFTVRRNNELIEAELTIKRIL